MVWVFTRRSDDRVRSQWRHDNRPPTGIEDVIAEGSIGIVIGWFFIKSWSMWRVRGAKPH
jgi:hypothetical protein